MVVVGGTVWYCTVVVVARGRAKGCVGGGWVSGCLWASVAEGAWCGIVWHRLASCGAVHARYMPPLPQMGDAPKYLCSCNRCTPAHPDSSSITTRPQKSTYPPSRGRTALRGQHSFRGQRTFALPLPLCSNTTHAVPSAPTPLHQELHRPQPPRQHHQPTPAPQPDAHLARLYTRHCSVTRGPRDPAAGATSTLFASDRPSERATTTNSTCHPGPPTTNLSQSPLAIRIPSSTISYSSAHLNALRAASIRPSAECLVCAGR